MSLRAHPTHRSSHHSSSHTSASAYRNDGERMKKKFRDAIYVGNFERVARIIKNILENETLDLTSVLLPYASRHVTPIGLAARRGHVKICRVLVEVIKDHVIRRHDQELDSDHELEMETLSEHEMTSGVSGVMLEFLTNNKMKALRDKEEQKGTEEDEQQEVEDNGVDNDSSSEQHNNTSISPQPVADDPNDSRSKPMIVSFSALPAEATADAPDAHSTSTPTSTISPVVAAGGAVPSGDAVSGGSGHEHKQSAGSMTMNEYIYDNKRHAKRRKKKTPKVGRSSSSDRLMRAQGFINDEPPVLTTAEVRRMEEMEREIESTRPYTPETSKHRKSRSLPYIHLHSMLNRLDGENRTALSHACEKGQKEVIEFLLSEQGIDMEAGGKHHEESWTNLHWACRYGHHEIVQLLLNKGANINAQTSKKKSTGLHLACATGHTEVIHVLLENEAAKEIEDVYGCSPLSLAIHFGEKKVQQILYEAGIDVSPHDARRLKKDNHIFRRFHWIKIPPSIATKVVLPDDVWCIVCGFLPCDELLLNVRLVSFGFLYVVHHPALRKLVNFKRSLPDKPDELVQYNESHQTLVLKAPSPENNFNVAGPPFAFMAPPPIAGAVPFAPPPAAAILAGPAPPVAAPPHHAAANALPAVGGGMVAVNGGGGGHGGNPPPNPFGAFPHFLIPASQAPPHHGGNGSHGTHGSHDSHGGAPSAMAATNNTTTNTTTSTVHPERTQSIPPHSSTVPSLTSTFIPNAAVLSADANGPIDIHDANDPNHAPNGHSEHSTEDIPPHDDTHNDHADDGDDEKHPENVPAVTTDADPTAPVLGTASRPSNHVVFDSIDFSAVEVEVENENEDEDGNEQHGVDEEEELTPPPLAAEHRPTISSSPIALGDDQEANRAMNGWLGIDGDMVLDHRPPIRQIGDSPPRRTRATTSNTDDSSSDLGDMNGQLSALIFNHLSPPSRGDPGQDVPSQRVDGDMHSDRNESIHSTMRRQQSEDSIPAPIPSDFSGLGTLTNLEPQSSDSLLQALLPPHISGHHHGHGDLGVIGRDPGQIQRSLTSHLSGPSMNGTNPQAVHQPFSGNLQTIHHRHRSLPSLASLPASVPQNICDSNINGFPTNMPLLSRNYSHNNFVQQNSDFQRLLSLSPPMSPSFRGIDENGRRIMVPANASQSSSSRTSSRGSPNRMVSPRMQMHHFFDVRQVMSAGNMTINLRENGTANVAHGDSQHANADGDRDGNRNGNRGDNVEEEEENGVMVRNVEDVVPVEFANNAPPRVHNNMIALCNNPMLQNSPMDHLFFGTAPGSAPGSAGASDVGSAGNDSNGLHPMVSRYDGGHNDDDRHHDEWRHPTNAEVNAQVMRLMNGNGPVIGMDPNDENYLHDRRVMISALDQLSAHSRARLRQQQQDELEAQTARDRDEEEDRLRGIDENEEAEKDEVHRTWQYKHCLWLACAVNFGPSTLRKIRLTGVSILTQPLIRVLSCLSFIVHLELAHFHAFKLTTMDLKQLSRVSQLKMIRQLKVFPVIRNNSYRAAMYDACAVATFITQIGSTALTLGIKYETIEIDQEEEKAIAVAMKRFDGHIRSANGHGHSPSPPDLKSLEHNVSGKGPAATATDPAITADVDPESKEMELHADASAEAVEPLVFDVDSPEVDMTRLSSLTWKSLFDHLPSNLRSLRLHFGKDDSLKSGAVDGLKNFESIKCFTLHGDPGLYGQIKEWSDVFQRWNKLRYIVLGHRNNTKELQVPKEILNALPPMLPELALNISVHSIPNVVWYLKHVVKAECFLRINLHVVHKHKSDLYHASIHNEIIPCLTRFHNLETAYLKCGMVTLQQIELLLQNCTKVSFVGFGIDASDEQQVASFRILLEEYGFDKIVVKNKLNWLIAVKSYDKLLLDPTRCIHPVLEAFDDKSCQTLSPLRQRGPRSSGRSAMALRENSHILPL